MTKHPSLWIRILVGFATLLVGLFIGQAAQAAVPQGSFPTTTPAAAVGNSPSAKIVAAAYAQVGVSQDCTALVTKSLAAAGINFHDSPAGYKSLGYKVSAAQALPGDLAYYNNGGAGTPHIAVYVGKGRAIHGGFNNTQTVVFSTNIGSGPQFVRVTGGPSVKVPPPPASAPVVAPPPKMKIHIVAAGESLSSIAASEGLSSWQSLWHSNPQVANPHLVFPGQQLLVPTGGP